MTTKKNDLSRFVSYYSACVGICLVLNLIIYRLIPRQLLTTTDIIGFPIFGNFNINRLVWGYYYLPLIFVTIGSAILFRIVAKKKNLIFSKNTSSSLKNEAVDGGQLMNEFEFFLKLRFVGFVLGIGLTFWSPLKNFSVLQICLSSGVFYGIVCNILTRGVVLWRKSSQNKDHDLLPQINLSRINLILLPLTLFIHYIISKYLQIQTEQGVRTLSFLPLYLPLFLCLWVYFRIWRALKKAPP